MGGEAAVNLVAIDTDVAEVESLKLKNDALQAAVKRLEKDKADLESRLEFVEELIGPTEAQRKTFQDQLCAARAAAVQAHRNGCALPVRFVGRLDEGWLRTQGLSERDCALLQRGCVTGPEGVPRDVSLLGDPAFKPYDEKTLQPIWEARGGLLRLSLGDVKSRWGAEVAQEVVKCTIELDRHDASRRLGVELPWHETEERELEPAEVVEALEREIAALRTAAGGRSSRTSDGVVGLSSNTAGSETSSTLDLFPRAQTAQDDSVGSAAAWSMLESDSFDPLGWDSMTDATDALESTRLDDDDESAALPSYRYPGSPSTSRPSTLPSPVQGLIPTAVGTTGAAADRWEDEWSLANADIEQLLRGGGTAGRSAHKSNPDQLGRSRGSTPRRGPSSSNVNNSNGSNNNSHNSNGNAQHRQASGSDRGPLDDNDDLGDVLRELLEEEVVGSLSRLLSTQVTSQLAAAAAATTSHQGSA